MGQRIKSIGVGVIGALIAVVATTATAHNTLADDSQTVNVPAVAAATQHVAKTLSGVHINGTATDQVPVKLTVAHGSLSFGQATGLTFSPAGTTSGPTLYVKGTVQDVNAALATLTYTGSTLGADSLDVSLVNYGEVFFPGNGHLYEYIPAVTEWGVAQVQASQLTRYGAQGYLATITSQAENDFINDKLLGAGWVGGSDSAVNGEWRWVTGPETGQQFWQGESAGSAVNGMYANWGPGLPDNYAGGEHCAQYGIQSTLTGTWNDLPCGGYWLQGYVAEFGASGDMPAVQRGAMTIHTLAAGQTYDDGDGVSGTVEDAVPNGGDINNNGVPDSLEPNVASLVSPVTGSYVGLALSDECALSGLSVNAPNTSGDSGYTYPYGMMDFTANCGTPGYETTVTQYHFGVNRGDLVVRKYNPATHAYAAVPGATITPVTIGGESALEVRYQVKDGGPLDTDGSANGVIVDPAGLALAAAVTAGGGTTSTQDSSQIGAPNTGFSRSGNAGFGSFDIVLAIAGGLIATAGGFAGWKIVRKLNISRR